MNADLRHRLRAGDPAALGELLDRFWAPLVDHLRRMLEDPDLAQDVAQDAFVRIWQRREDLRPDGSLEVFLYQIARNGARDARRRRRTRESWAREAGRIPRDLATQPDPAELRELATAVNRAIASLSDRRREVFLLLRTSQLTHRDAAKVLGISPQTVANLMSHALEDLRTALAGFLEA